LEKSEDSAVIGPVASQAGWLNPANLMTLLRAVLAPPIILVLVYKPSHWSFVAGMIFVVAALTDKADGYYARRYDAVTRIGEFLDPLADKLLMIPVMLTLSFVKVGGQVLLPLWVTVIVIARELLISSFRLIGARKGISFPASWSGKIKMFSQVIVVGVILFFPSSANELAVRILVYLMAAITVYSGIDYLFRARREIFKPSGKSESSRDAGTSEA
jgi:CDP-diacylglycerol--glycerol-3-phosphate 3-phosphatidyltransferase